MSSDRYRGDVLLTQADVMAALGLGDETVVSRKQMAEFLKLAVDPDDLPSHSRGRRYRLVEVAGARAAIELLKVQTGWIDGKLKSNLTPLRKACSKLWGMGVRYPLAQGVLSWNSVIGRYVFSFNGFLIDTKSGQAQLQELLATISHAADDDHAAMADDFRIAIRRGEAVTSLTLVEKSQPAFGMPIALLL